MANFLFPKKKSSRIEIEDEYAIRIEAEWVRRSGRLDLEEIMRRYEKASKPLTVKAEEKINLEGLPRGWNATRFVFKETAGGKDSKIKLIHHELITAFYLCPEKTLFCFFLIHFLPEDKEDPTELTQTLTRTFQDHRGQAYVPWELFDINYSIPKDFEFDHLSIDIGSKKMIFEWERRRLFIWTYSCADVFLKNAKSKEYWAVGSLNGSKPIKGIIFRLNKDGTIGWRRNRMHPFGLRDEIWRWCFKYQIYCKLLPEKNQFMVVVYQYRNAEDLHRLPDL